MVATTSRNMHILYSLLIPIDAKACLFVIVMQDASISAFAHLFFASATSFYLNEIGRLRAARQEFIF